MLNAAIIGLGWWGKRLVGSVKGSQLIRFSRGVTLEPELAREFAAEHGLVEARRSAEIAHRDGDVVDHGDSYGRPLVRDAAFGGSSP